jgi:hypothetical protein
MTPQSNWLHIAEQTSEEKDPAKLMTLVSKLCQAIDGERREKSIQQGSTEPSTI